MKLNKTINIKLNSQDLTLFFKKKSVLLNLQVLKTKIYEKNLDFKKSFFEIEGKFTELKIALTIIYSYHFSNRTILFIGIPNKLIGILTKIEHSHIFLPSNLWLKGIFTNKSSIRRYLKYQKLKKTKIKLTMNKINKLLVVTKTPKLIVIINNLADQAIINEIYKLRFPIIDLNFNKTVFQKSFYKVFKDSHFNTISLNLLSSLFIKGKHLLELFKNEIKVNTNFKYQYKPTNKKPLEKILKKKLEKNKTSQLWKSFTDNQ